MLKFFSLLDNPKIYYIISKIKGKCMDDTTQKKLKILSAIDEIHQSIGANLELQEISRILVDKLAEITNCQGCAILIIEGQKLAILSEKGFLEGFKDVEFTVDMPTIKYIIESKKSVFTNDLPNSEMSQCVPDRCAMNSLICVPVVVKGEVKGIIHLDSLEKNAFDEDDLQFIEILAGQVSIAFERAFLYEKVKDISIHDGLTGAFNRRKLDEDLENEIERCKRYKRQLSLLMVDIDWFKKYNDFHGHPAGDELLKKIVSLFQKNIRSVDRVYRYGGEEFVILLPEIEKKDALTFAERIREIVQQEKFEGEEKSQPNKKVTISIGAANFPLDADSKDGLIKAADIALYQAKQSGRNRVCAFNN